MVSTHVVSPAVERANRDVLLPLAVTFVVLDLVALAMLGPITPGDTIGDVQALYGDRSTAVVASRFVHGLGLVAAFAFFGVLIGRLRSSDGADGTLTRVGWGGFVALVPIEIVRNVIMTTLALRFDDIGEPALALHLVAVLLGPAIAFPVTASVGALAILRRSPVLGAVAGAWLLSAARLLTTSSAVWFAGVSAFAALVVALLALAFRLRR